MGNSRITSEPAVILLVLLTAAALLPAFFVGFQASDDASYLHGALGWLDRFPYIGDSHWTLRHTITLPTALSIMVIGLNDVATGFPNVVYFCLFLVLNTFAAARFLGRGTALTAGLLVVTLPGFLIVSTYLNPDIPELFYVSLALWMFVWGCRKSGSVTPWLLCGIVWSLAFLNRQTALSYALFLGFLFLFKPIVPRKRYLLIAVGALPLLIAEWVYLYSFTGDPLYRYRVDYNHDSIDRAARVDQARTAGGILDSEGNVAVNVYLDPFVNLFISQKYALTFWLAAFAGWSLWKRRRTLGLTAQPLALLGGLGLISFIFVAANPRLLLVPRYFIVVAWTGAMVASYWIAMLWAEGQRTRVLGLATLIFCVNAAALMVENTNPRFGERELAAWVAKHPGETIHADSETKFRAEYFFMFRGVKSDTVLISPPTTGATVFHSHEGIRRCSTSPRCRDLVHHYQPAPSWESVESIAPPERVLVRIGRFVGLDRILPEDLGRRLTRPVSPAVIYRIPVTDTNVNKPYE
jgi:4-amino-4-deoxy-L-arabinose transferase-like glycosyltransferase